MLKFDIHSMNEQGELICVRTNGVEQFTVYNMYQYRLNCGRITIYGAFYPVCWETDTIRWGDNRFIPTHLLTEKELFLLKLGGKIPDRFVHEH